MKLTKPLFAFALAASAFAMNAHAGVFDVTAKIYGAPATASAAQRTIDITPDTRKVLVTNGETIQFNVDGKPFTWKFDLYHQEGILDLATILPQDLQASGVKVYVAESPDYRAMYRN
jgi:hypothetical protein